MKNIKTGKILFNIFFILLAIILCLLMIQILLVKVKVPVFLSIVILAFILSWYYMPMMDTRKIILAFIFIYPLLPCLAGFQIAPGIPVLRTQRIATMFIILFLFRKKLLYQYYRDFLSSNVFTYPLFFMVLTLFLAMFFSLNRGGSLFQLVSLVFETVILSVMTFATFKTEEDINSLIKVMAFSLFTVCALGIYERITQHNIFFAFGVFNEALASGIEHTVRYDTIRIQAAFEHPIALGAYLAIVLPVVLYRYRDSGLAFNLSLGLVALATYFTQSRSGMIGLVIVFVSGFFIHDKKYYIFSIILIIMVLVPNIQTIMDYYWGIDEILDSQYLQTERTRQFYFLIEYIKENLAFGYGAIDPPAHLVSDMFGMGQALQATIDNYYLLYTFHYGLVGLAGYLVFMLSIFVKPLQTFRAKIFTNKLMLSILVSAFVVLLINVICALFSFFFVLWIYVGLITRLIVNEREQNPIRH